MPNLSLRKSISRRTCLRGAGVSLALPFLETMSARAAAVDPLPKRFVAINIPLGFHADHFFPEKDGPDYAMSPYLKLVEHLREDFTVISGTSHPGVDGGHAAEKSFLTAAPHPGSRTFKNSVSLDRVIADRIGGATRFASLTVGDSSLSWSANGVPVPHQGDPGEVFSDLFLAGTSAEVVRQKQLIRDGKSILDVVLGDARSMAGKVSVRDREKLDQYFTAVRETESRLVKAGNWVDTPKPGVTAKKPGRFESRDIVGRMRAHFEVMRLAIQTDSTRVIAYGGNGGSQVLPIKGVSIGYHGLTHHGKDPRKIEQLERIDRAVIQAWGDFLNSLRQSAEGEGNLLTNTQVLLGSNLGNANSHSTRNLPIILAGGDFRHGRHLRFDARDNEPLPNLFVSQLQAMGIDRESFASSSGRMRGLD